MSEDLGLRSLARRDATRRGFIKVSGAVALGVFAGPLLEACGGGEAAPSAPASSALPKAQKGAKITLVQWNSFVPAADEELRRQAREFGEANGCEVTIETISADDIDTRIAAAVTAGEGPDIFQLRYAGPLLYASSIVDVTDDVNYLKSKLGALDPVTEAYIKSGAKYKAVPYCMTPNAWSYRTDIWDKVGVKAFPGTWEELAGVGAKLKAAGLPPIAQALGHAYGDATTMWYPVLWSYGGKEVAEDGKTVAINSKETLLALQWATDAWQKGYLSKDTLSWKDPDNNQAYEAGTISATLNGASIYIKALNTKKWDTVTQNAGMPKGPAGTFTVNLAWNNCVMKWSKFQETARAFLLYLGRADNYSKWLGASRGYNAGTFKSFDDDPVWSSDRKLVPFRDVVKSGKWPGWPAKPSKLTQKVQNQYIVTDMFAKAVSTNDPRAAMLDAEQKLKQVYSAP